MKSKGKDYVFMLCLHDYTIGVFDTFDGAYEMRNKKRAWVRENRDTAEALGVLITAYRIQVMELLS